METLLQLEFPEHLVRGIAGMYQGLRYQVVTNGVVAEPFHVGIGVKQGCPLSPMLYNLYVQPLSGALSALDKGPCFPGLPGCHPDYHYADDAALMAEYLPDLQALLTHTNVVLAARTLKLSVPKCIGLVLGLQAGAPVGECSLSLGSAPLASASPTEGTRYLGLIYECMEFRRSEECEDYNPYFDLSLFGDEWQGRIFDTFSSGPRGDIAETFTSDGPGSSISAHGA